MVNKSEAKWWNSDTEELFSAILALKNIDEAKKFLRDLLTEKEIIEFAARWKVVKMLNQNVPYTKIEAETKMSSTTIARIADWLKNGMGGYPLMLNRLHHHSQLKNSS